MTIPAIRCTRSQSPVQENLEIEEIAGATSPVVFLTPPSTRACFESRRDCFECLARHRSKSLKTYLGRRSGKIPVLATEYQEPTRLRSSVSRLLDGAGEARLVCVLLVSEKMWGLLTSERSGKTPSALHETTPYVREFGYDKREQTLADNFWGGTGEIVEVRQKILLAAGQGEPVLITGPTGCGKTKIARLIHGRSPRKDGPFVAVNCGAIPSELLEAELFGVEKGIGLPNTTTKIGLWERAAHGTLFLDEVGDLRLDHQVKILHVLDTGRFRRVGGIEEIESDARVIAATNRPLRDMLAENTFRSDLYSRLGTFGIQMPPLDSHREDIPRLAQKIWSEVAPDKSPLKREALDFLKSVSWPDNVRGLQNALRKVAVYVRDGAPTRGQLAYVVAETFPALHARSGAAPSTDSLAEYGPHAEFMRHLRRLDRLHASIAEALLLFGLERDLRASEVGTIRRTVTSGCDELHTLLREPLLFFDEGLAGRARLLAEALDKMLRLLPPTAKRRGDEAVPVEDAKRFYADVLAGRLREVRSLLFDTIHLILAGQSAPRRSSGPAQRAHR
jgi:DNA-binding NtrC family response regulator